LISVWHLAQREELRSALREFHTVEADGGRHCIAATDTGLWVVSDWATARVAFRVAFSPRALNVEDVTVDDDGLSIGVAMSTVIGAQAATITIDPRDATMSTSTTLRPAADLFFPGWPRDVIADLDERAEGIVHASQRGLRTGLVHASLKGPANGSFMYLQDLTLLGDYCDATHASARDTVGGEWPDLGFALPTGSHCLPEGKPMQVSNWHVAFAEDVPDGPVAIADQYLDFLSRLYLHIDRPTPEYVDWRQRAQSARTDLDRCSDCWITLNHTRYLRAYVGDPNHPPESMVQLAVLLPLIERSEWCEHDDPLVEELRGLVPRFHDHRTGTMARWLPEAQDMLDGTEPHERPRVMDSWYVFHPILNLARLAEHGDADALTQLLESLDPLIDVAHHFKYEWPVFYDVDTLEVLRAESEPGKGGERDVPGLYAHVMLQAFELTDEQRYLDEALAAARSLRGKGFEISYQMNNVAFGMLALLRLFKLTGDRELLDISRVLCACLFDNTGLWSTRYGNARDRSSFFGIFPMPNAPYTAAYEQAEVTAASLDYLRHAGEDVTPAVAVLVGDLIRHVTARLETYYPPNIAPEAITDAPKTGHIVRDLWIPVEDLADGWDEAGTVGQEVYGAGIAFSTLARSYVRVPDRNIEVYCEYPFTVVHAECDRVEVQVHGDHRLQTRFRVLARDDAAPLDAVAVVGSSTGELKAANTSADWREYWVPAGQLVTVTFE
jgi:hypothetical protein